MLSDWLSDNNILNVKEFSEIFLDNNPFEYVYIDNFLREDKFNELYSALKEEKYFLENSDLFEYFKTEDFKNNKNIIIREFRNFLKSEEFMSFLESIGNFNLDRSRMSLYSLKFKQNNYLLCNNGFDIKKKLVGFDLNFVDFNDGEGGDFELFSLVNEKPFKVVKSISSKKNRFIIFKVNSLKSFYQISEVLCSDKNRDSIRGGYYDN